jgi:hypothetical protein
VDHYTAWCSLDAKYQNFWRYRNCITAGAQYYAFLANSSSPESPEDLAQKVLVSNFSKYSNSNRRIGVSGSMTITEGFSSTPSLILKWSFKELDPACQSRSGKQCAIQIHADEHCNHYARIGEDDPLIVVEYEASSDGESEMVSGVEVATNLSVTEVLGKTVIAYDSLGSEIACGEIPFGPGRSRSDDLLSGAVGQARFAFVTLVLCACQTLLF